MSPIAVFVPLECGEVPDGLGEVTVAGYESQRQLCALMAEMPGVQAVIVSMEFTDEEQGWIADAIRIVNITAIEVRCDRWDGFTPSRLSAACRGVISGFGMAGVPAALAILRGT